MLAKPRDRIAQSIEDWREDWQSGRGDRYLSHYADDFKGRGMNKAQWVAYKKQVTSNKAYIQVGISDLSIYGYPDEPNLIEVSFEQQYRSDRFSSHARKVQYWRQGSNGDWKIVGEEAG